MVIGIAWAALVGVTCPALDVVPPAACEPAELGRRVAQVEEAIPTIDRVVLVADAATYVDELSRWSPVGRWPVLFHDDELAPTFIRRFRPAEVILRGARGTEARRHGGTKELDARLDGVIVRAWGGTPHRYTPREVFEIQQYTPPGAVIASSGDPAWTAAVALAAGRGQPILWIDDDFGRPTDVVDQRVASLLAERLSQLLIEAGYSQPHNVGALTICRAMPGGVMVPVAGPGESGKVEPIAMTDYLGRDDDGRRFAFVGWIFGDERRAAYMAMCSLFLPRERIWLHNSFPVGGEHETYGIVGATAMLSERGCEVRDFSSARAAEQHWLELLPGGIAADVLVMNARGSAGRLELPAGAAYPSDMPMLKTPVAVHMTHPWSLRSPEDADTIGGCWLARGAYAYVGAVHEASRSAFVPPLTLAERWMGFAPWLIAARQWDASPPVGGPWKVNTIGDPLMLMPPPIEHTRRRVAESADYGVNLHERARELMRQAGREGDGDVFAEAIAMLTLLGRDELAVQMWLHAERSGVESHVAPSALGPLFREDDVDGFVRAFQYVETPDERALDMLWHLLTPRLGELDAERLELLARWTRPTMAEVDRERLAPHLAVGE
jgi:hypothetical protein